MSVLPERGAGCVDAPSPLNSACSSLNTPLLCCTQDREGSAPLPQVDEHGGPPSHPSQQEAVRVEPRQADPQDQGVGDAAGARAAVGPEQVLSSSCFEPPLSPTWLRIRPEPVPPGAWASAATLGACGSESAAPSFWRGWCEVWCGSL